MKTVWGKRGPVESWERCGGGMEIDVGCNCCCAQVMWREWIELERSRAGAYMQNSKQVHMPGERSYELREAIKAAIGKPAELVQFACEHLSQAV